ncbi:hypothetical protein BP354E_5809 [Burkholderia pseudomallei 354e]|nr:hypothetical protein BP354E_5809 [Burkholderia pseudomallei 354e]EIF72604.1 hypothetical protein BP354A_6022 [Burkholderia pseudomallei 354a]
MQQIFRGAPLVFVNAQSNAKISASSAAIRTLPFLRSCACVSEPLPWRSSMAKPFIENGTWAFRICIDGNRIYKCGYDTEAKAREAMNMLKAEHRQVDRAAGQGAHRTTVAAALLNYGLQTLPAKKGAAKEVNRINRYLRLAGCPVLEVKPVEEVAGVKASMRGKSSNSPVYFTASVRAPEPARAIPSSLKAHRESLDSESRKSDAVRQQIANTRVADVTPLQLKALVDTMLKDDYGASSVHNEIAVLRQMFKHARKVWSWSRPINNPAAMLELPTIDNARDRILSEDEWQKLVVPLADYENPYVLPLVSLMLETAMRSSEPLTKLHWQDVDWERHLIRLPGSKGGKRDVPLSPGAQLILQAMQQRSPNARPEDRVFPITYEALKAGWRDACNGAGIEGVNLHDLRHTCATRYAIELDGNVFKLKKITGHKTLVMVDRYVNLTAEHVAAELHGEEYGQHIAPAGHLTNISVSAIQFISHEYWLRPRKRSSWELELRKAETLEAEAQNDVQSNVVYLRFGRAA